MATADASDVSATTAAGTAPAEAAEVDESGAVADDEVEEAGSNEEGDGEEDFDEDEGGEQYVVLKFLLSTEAAGSVIGKNGVTVNELQAQSGTKIQLSKAREFFPGTQERMMLLCGTVSQVLVALHLVFTKLMADGVSMLSCSSTAAAAAEAAEGGTEEGGGGHKELESAMVVPNRLCGGIIGKGGATIHSFMEDSDAQISVSNIHEATGFGERVIHIKGSRESQLRAVALLATKMAEDRHYSTDEIPLSYPALGEGGHPIMYTAAGAHHHVPYAYTHAHATHAAASVALHHSPAAYHPPHHHAEAPPPHVDLHHHHHHLPHAYHHRQHHGPEGAYPEVGDSGEEEGHMYFMLPDEAVGVIIGKQGRTIQSIRQRSGAHVKIEDSHGTGQRLLAVTGTAAAIAAVEGMIVTRLQQQGKEAALQRLGPNPELPYHHPADPSAVTSQSNGYNDSHKQQPQAKQQEEANQFQGEDEQSDAPPIEAVMQALHM